MASDYDDTHPTDKDKVRALIPDITTTDFLLTNEQINLVLEFQSYVRLAAADSCDIIITLLGRYAQSKTISAGAGVSITVNQAPKFFKERAKSLREAVQSGEPFFSSDNFDYFKDNFGNDLTGYVGD